MNKFIFTPFVVIAAIFLFLITPIFLIMHVILKVGIKVLNLFLWAAGYSYQFYLDAEEVEK